MRVKVQTRGGVEVATVVTSTGACSQVRETSMTMANIQYRPSVPKLQSVTSRAPPDSFGATDSRTEVDRRYSRFFDKFNILYKSILPSYLCRLVDLWADSINPNRATVMVKDW